MDEEDITTEFPPEYSTVLDELVVQESFTSEYQEEGAEFVSARTVKVPVRHFDGGTVDYDGFKTKGEADITYDVYNLDKDKQKAFVKDALDVTDQPLLDMNDLAIGFEREHYVPEIDAYFFDKAAKAAKTKAATNLTAANIKAELRAAKTQLKQAGYTAANLYMSSDALACLEEATNRQFAGEDVITDEVGKYNFFHVFEVPDDRLGDADFIAIGKTADKKMKPIRFITKRAVTKIFSPEINQNGDNWELQMRWVYGTVALKNKAAGIYVNAGDEDPDCSVKPVTLVASAPAGATAASVNAGDEGKVEVTQ